MKWEKKLDLKKKCTPPQIIFLHQTLFVSKNVGNSIKREQNMKWENKKFLTFLFFNISKIHNKFKQHPINIKNYIVHPHDMVHVPAKFWANTALPLRYWVTVRKLNVMDRWTDRRMGGGGGGAFGAVGITKNFCNAIPNPVCHILTSLFLISVQTQHSVQQYALVPWSVCGDSCWNKRTDTMRRTNDPESIISATLQC